MENSNKSRIIIVVIIAIVLILIITIPSFVLNNKKSESKYFPTYEDIDIKNINTNENSTPKYTSLKTHLENDQNFAREMLLGDYNYNTFDGYNLRMLIKHYIFSFQLTNLKYLSVMDEEKGRFCMKEKYVKESFKELYNIDISKKLDYLPGYFEYVIKDASTYCFNYRNVSKEYDDQISIGIEEMSTKTGIVKATIYVYEYHNNDTENQKNAINNLKKYISNNDFNSANNLVINSLNGTVTHKNVQFRVKNDGKFFKYQVLMSKILDN